MPIAFGIAQTAKFEFENGSPEKDFAESIGRYDEWVTKAYNYKNGF